MSKAFAVTFNFAMRSLESLSILNGLTIWAPCSLRKLNKHVRKMFKIWVSVANRREVDVILSGLCYPHYRSTRGLTVADFSMKLIDINYIFITVPDVPFWGKLATGPSQVLHLVGSMSLVVAPALLLWGLPFLMHLAFCWSVPLSSLP